MNGTQHFTVVFLREDNGTVSAYLPALPDVYAAADTLGGARRGIRDALEGYLGAMSARDWHVPAARAEAARRPPAPGGVGDLNLHAVRAADPIRGRRPSALALDSSRLRDKGRPRSGIA